MTSKDSAYKKIAELVERFEEQYDSYKKSDYNETLTRRDFIDPFFKALGWDVDNEYGNAESYREVIHEDRVKVGDESKAPDYSFRFAGGKRLFFVEAKKPSVSLKDEIQPAYQVRRYGWSAKLPISIITDFEEFAIYDCTKKPSPTDKASIARIKYLTFREYLKDFDFIWETFSKERALKGGLDKYIKSDSNKKGTTTVDKDFLKSLDEWRAQLASTVSWNNKTLNEEEINFVVQQTIDRIIFLRIAEDRSVEEYGHLKQTIKEGNFYNNLFNLFELADSKYNSGLFDFKKDKISKTLSVDNKVLIKILKELYYPSPYAFAAMPVEILGTAYEQFLGKQIKIDKAHRAHIEEKPEVRKAGGVYYTPEYIVEYIVNNTVGKLIENKSPKEIAKIKIVDPACGSGSFLIGAYDCLLNEHRKFYLPEFKRLSDIAQNSKDYNDKQRKDAIKERNKMPLTPDGYLTTAIKKEILINNLHGVDIDVNAVEVTKLSLLLKCMEGETQSSINAEMRFGERVLPTLDNNIKDGNSLIDTDFYSSQLDFGEEKKIKPFNWKNAFQNVFKAGGFDCVIGNPPYVRQELLGDLKIYFEAHYEVYHGTADLYSYFIEKGINLLNDKGIFGIIVANKWMRTNYGEPLRKWLKQQAIYEIIDFGDLPVFESATTYPCILIAAKSDKKIKNIQVSKIKALDFDSLQKYVNENKKNVLKDNLNEAAWNLGSEIENDLLKKLKQNSVTLSEYVKGNIYYGIKTGLNEAFVIDEETKAKLIQEDKKSSDIIKPFLAGRDIKKYQKPHSNKYLIFAKRGIDIDNYPAIKNHLQKFKKQLLPKPKDFSGSNWEGRKPGAYKWFEIQDAVDYFGEFEKPKIIYPNILKKPEFIFDSDNWFTNQKCFIISIPDKYLLGILNSKLNHYLFEKYLPKLRGGFYEPSSVFFKNFPIKKIESKNKEQVNLQGEIISLVDKILELNKTKPRLKLQSAISHFESQIEYYEKRIDEIVYQLYDLTDDEIKIVEEV